MLIADIHPLQGVLPAPAAFAGEDAVPEYQWGVFGHFIHGLARGFLYVEEVVYEGEGFEALADEEEDGCHVPDLVPEEGGAVEGEGVELWTSWLC